MARELVARGADVHARSGGGPGGGAGAARAASRRFSGRRRPATSTCWSRCWRWGPIRRAVTNDGAGAVLLAAGSRELDAVRFTVEIGLDVNVHPPGPP